MSNFFGGLRRVYGHPNNLGHPFRTTLKVGWWLINRHFFKLPVIGELSTGVKLICYPTSSYGSLVIYTGLPEYAEQMLMYQLTAADDIIIDIGAHIGSETVLLGSKLKSGRIYAFEPTPKISTELIDNIKLNKLENIAIPILAAVSNKNGYLNFYLSQSSETNSLTQTKGGKALRVRSVTLDNFCKANKLNTIDILKIDVEGSELSVVEGASNLLSSNDIKLIVFEVNNLNAKVRVDNLKVQQILYGYGYKLYTVSDNLLLSPYEPSRYAHIVHNVVAVSSRLSTTKKRLLGL